MNASNAYAIGSDEVFHKIPNGVLAEVLAEALTLSPPKVVASINPFGGGEVLAGRLS